MKKKRKAAPAIVFGNSAVVALGLARSLATNGIDVYYVTDSRNAAMFSRHLKSFLVVPDIEKDTESMIAFLQEFKKKHSYSVIFPGSDNSCLELASARSLLDDRTQEGFHFSMPSKEVVETLVNKRRFCQSISKTDIPRPLTYCPRDLDDVVKIGLEAGYPVFVKPSYSQVFQDTFYTKGFIAKSKEELMGYYRLAAKHNIDVVIQEIIPGPESECYGVNAYFDRWHNPQGLFAYRRLRSWPTSFGVGCLIESIPLSTIPEVKNLVSYLHSLGHYGLTDAEFKRDSRDGEFKFLEVNSRLWLQNSFPTKCGINQNLMAYLDAMDDPPIKNRSYQVGIRWEHFLYDIRSATEMLGNRQISIFEWINSLQRIRDNAYSPVDDFFPWAISPLFSLIGERSRKRWSTSW